jgi:hypothetical protein
VRASSFSGFVEPASAAFLRRRLFLFLRNIRRGALGTRALMVGAGYFCFYKLVPSPNMRGRLNEAVRVFNFVLLKDFFKIQRLKISGRVDDVAVLNLQTFIVFYWDAFGFDFVIKTLRPEEFPLSFDFFNDFFLVFVFACAGFWGTIPGGVGGGLGFRIVGYAGTSWTT